MNIVTRRYTTKSNLVKFLHAAYFGPIAQAWRKVVDNNHFTTWPGLSSKLIKRHLSPLMTTVKGHLCQEYQGICSTKTQVQ